MSNCTTYRVEVDGCVDGVKTVAVELYAGLPGATGPSGIPSSIPGATGATGPIPSSAVVATQISRFTGDGISSVFSPLTGFQSGDNGARYLVQLDGVEQDPDPTNGAFVIASNQITFAAAIPAGVNIVVRRLTVSLS